MVEVDGASFVDNRNLQCLGAISILFRQRDHAENLIAIVYSRLEDGGLDQSDVDIVLWASPILALVLGLGSAFLALSILLLAALVRLAL